MKTTKYYFNPETINHFQFLSSYISGEELYEKIQEFVEIECTLEDGETEEELVDDLLKQVNNEDENMGDTCRNGKEWDKCECC